MFHRPASITGTSGAPNILPQTSNGDIVMNENENSMMHRNIKKPTGAMGTVPGMGLDNPTKTPASKSTAGRRRAFGDISNKKTKNGPSSQGGFGQAKANQSLKKDASNALKPSSRSSKLALQPSTLPTPSLRAAKTPGAKAPVSMIPRMSTSQRGPLKTSATTTTTTTKRSIIPKPEQRSVTFLKHPKSSSSLSPLRATKSSIIKAPKSSSRKALAPLSNNTTKPIIHSEPPKSKSTSENMTRRKSTFRIEEPVPDIELPAGRTWKQQLEYDLKDEDDAASTSTLDELWKENGVDSFDERAMWDDWKESMRQEMELKAKQADRMIQEQIDAVFEQDRQDYEKGLESLCDIVDGLDILSEGDLNLSIIKDDDDDWSLPASSLCGPGAEDSFFQL